MLTFAQTTDDKGTIETHTFAKCPDQSVRPDTPTHFEASKEWQAQTLKLCETVPWFRWTVTVKTASKLGSGTDADIQARLSCGGKPVTGQLKLDCSYNPTFCFERCARTLQPQGGGRCVLTIGGLQCRWLRAGHLHASEHNQL